jgi:hypothetical protein
MSPGPIDPAQLAALSPGHAMDLSAYTVMVQTPAASQTVVFGLMFHVHQPASGRFVFRNSLAGTRAITYLSVIFITSACSLIRLANSDCTACSVETAVSYSL